MLATLTYVLEGSSGDASVILKGQVCLVVVVVVVVRGAQGAGALLTLTRLRTEPY